MSSRQAVEAVTHPSDDALDREIRAFEVVKADLEAKYLDRWVVFSGGKLWRDFDSFQDAAIAADAEFGSKVVLIRQVGAPTTMALPISLLVERPYVPS